MSARSNLLTAVVFPLLFVLALLAWIAVLRAQDASALATYKNPRFGFELRYPSDVFTPGEPPANGDGLAFTSRDGAAKIVTFAAFNNEGFTPKSYRAQLMAEYRDRYQLLDYQPQGRTWFVLSGYRGDSVFYEKVMFSCGGDIINVLAISYPRAEEAFYNPIVEIIEDGFRPGRGLDGTAKCR